MNELKNPFRKLSTPFGETEIHFAEAFGKLKECCADRKVILMTDQRIHDRYASELATYETIILEEGDKTKTLAEAEKVWSKLLDLGASRQHLIVGFGGGAVTDFAGFIASTFMRGIDFGLVPTTLLAQVDAAIGGKTGLNLGDYKNMIGTFTMPKFLILDPTLLHSLKEEHFRQGFAEVVKHALIRDIELFNWLEDNADGLLNKETVFLKECVQRAAEIKLQVVEQDGEEKGLRKTLNFGHTVGHAIEKRSALNHGDAVGIGMVQALKLSGQEENLSKENVLRATTLIEKFGLPTKLNASIDEIWDTLQKDKKGTGDGIDFILLKQLGEAYIQHYSFDELKKALKKINE